MHAMLLPLAILFGIYHSVIAVTITTTVPAQPQAPAISLSATVTASASAISNAVRPMTSPFSNATTTAPLLASGCSANCTFTWPNYKSGSWKRCADENAIYFAGQVKYVVDRLKNKTLTTTIYSGEITYSINGTAITAEASDVMSNGSFKYSRTDVNEAGTVTAVDYDYVSSEQHELAYPTAAINFGLEEYAWAGVLPYATNGTTECVTATEDPYSYPTDVVLPTRQVEHLDSEDPRGLSYCYDRGLSDAGDVWFWPLFKGTIIEALHNESNCKQQAGAAAPVVVADQATFLLETITDFVDGPETESPTPSPSPSPSTNADPRPTGVIVDPFQTISKTEDEQKPSQSESDTKSSPASPTVVKSVETKPAPGRTTSATKQSVEASVSPADHSSSLSNHDNQSESSESPSAKPTAPADEASESPSVKPTAPADQVSESRVTKTTAPASEVSNSSDRPTASPKTSQLGILNSIIQQIGQHQSSVGPTASTGNDAPKLTLNGVTATPDSSTQYVLGEQTLKPGGPAITVSGTQISLASGASAIVLGSSTSVLVASGGAGNHVQDVATAPVLTLTANSNSASEYVVGEQTIKPGGPAITISGTPISLDSHATAVVVGSSTGPVAVVSNGGDRSQQAEGQSAGKPASRLTLAGTTATLNSASEYVIADQTLEPGGPAITISGTPISLASQATAVVVGSSTSILATVSHDGDQTQQAGKLAPVLTLAGATATLNSASEYILNGQTLTPGENAITISGTRISLAPHATAVVIGSTTSVLAAASSNIGDYVWAGIAGVLVAAEASSTVPSEASETKSGSEVVVTSTAGDGNVVVETISTVEPASSSTSDLSSSSAGTSSLASGGASSTSSSSPAESSDVASGADSKKSNASAAALVCWTGLFMMFGL